MYVHSVKNIVLIRILCMLMYVCNVSIYAGNEYGIHMAFDLLLLGNLMFPVCCNTLAVFLYILSVAGAEVS